MAGRPPADQTSGYFIDVRSKPEICQTSLQRWRPPARTFPETFE